MAQDVCPWPATRGFPALASSELYEADEEPTEEIRTTLPAVPRAHLPWAALGNPFNCTCWFKEPQLSPFQTGGMQEPTQGSTNLLAGDEALVSGVTLDVFLNLPGLLLPHL